MPRFESSIHKIPPQLCQLLLFVGRVRCDPLLANMQFLFPQPTETAISPILLNSFRDMIFLASFLFINNLFPLIPE